MDIEKDKRFLRNKIDYAAAMTLLISMLVFFWCINTNIIYIKNGINLQKVLILCFFIPFTISVFWLCIARSSFILQKFPIIRNKYFKISASILTFLFISIIRYVVNAIHEIYR